MPYLDGERVDSAVIDPKKHRFIGVFRPPMHPTPTMNNTWTAFMCLCGHTLFTQEACLDHWSQGHLDMPQYISIVEEL